MNAPPNHPISASLGLRLLLTGVFLSGIFWLMASKSDGERRKGNPLAYGSWLGVRTSMYACALLALVGLIVLLLSPFFS